MAPEIFRVYEQEAGDFSYSNKCDIWSLGTVLYEMLLGHNLTKIIKFSKKTQKINQLKEFLLREEDIPISDSGLSHEAVDLLGKMLKKNPFQRISIDQILAHPWMVRTPRDSDQTSLLISFFLVDDLQQQGKLTKVFFDLRQTKVNVCKIFINQITREVLQLYLKLENFMEKAIGLEARLEEARVALGNEAHELFEQEWNGLFSACLRKVKALFEKVNDLNFQMSNKHAHMMYNFFIQSRRSMKAYEACCRLVKTVEERLGSNFSSLRSRTNADDFETLNQSEPGLNLRVQEGLLNCVEILHHVVLHEYWRQAGAIHVRDILVDCFDVLSFDVSELSYSINFKRALAEDVPDSVYSISYFLGNILKINELDSRSSKSFQSDEESAPTSHFQRQFNLYKHSQLGDSQESGFLFEEDDQMQKIANLVEIRIKWATVEVFRKKSVQTLSKRLFDTFRKFDFKAKQSDQGELSIFWSGFSGDEEEESNGEGMDREMGGQSWGNSSSSVSEFK